MHIIYSDEYDKLTPEMVKLMDQAADTALSFEFGAELESAEISADDTEAELSLTIVSDEEIRELNREYRGKDSVTDVLSFPQFDGHDELLSDLINTQATLIGDVVICFDQAARQAEEYGTGMTREMLYLFVHSLMHLFGYDHMEEEEKKIMRSKEEAVLSEMGISR